MRVTFASIVFLLFCAIGYPAQFLLKKECPIYYNTGGEIIGYLFSNIAVDFIDSKRQTFDIAEHQPSRLYLKIRVVAWIHKASIQLPLDQSRIISIGANGATLFEGIDGDSIGNVNPAVPVNLDSLVGEWAQVSFQGWIQDHGYDILHLEQGTQNRAMLDSKIQSPVTTLSDIQKYDAVSKSRTFVTAGLCLLAASAVSFIGASHVGIEIESCDQAVDSFSRYHIPVPDWLEKRRDDYKSVQTRYTVTCIVTALAGTVFVIHGIASHTATTQKQSFSISPMTKFSKAPMLGLCIRF